MKIGDLIRYKQIHRKPIGAMGETAYLVRWVEKKNNWVCVYGIEPPLQMSLMEVISEGR